MAIVDYTHISEIKNTLGEILSDRKSLAINALAANTLLLPIYTGIDTFIYNFSSANTPNIIEPISIISLSSIIYNEGLSKYKNYITDYFKIEPNEKSLNYAINYSYSLIFLSISVPLIYRYFGINTEEALTGSLIAISTAPILGSAIDYTQNKFTNLISNNQKQSKLSKKINEQLGIIPIIATSLLISNNLSEIKQTHPQYNLIFQIEKEDSLNYKEYKLNLRSNREKRNAKKKT